MGLSERIQAPSATILSTEAMDGYLAFACRVAESAGRAILEHFRAPLQVHNKGPVGEFDPVTVADREAEAIIRAEIRQAYPGHGILGEEEERHVGEEPWTWVIDPIDGTRAFMIGQLHWGILLGLSDVSRPVLGLLHQPYLGETFVGRPGRAELRRPHSTTLLRVRRCSLLEEAVVCTTDPAFFAHGKERAAFELVASKARLVRFGGDCYSYGMLAAGLIDLVIESRLKPFDIQPLVPMIEAAGGVVTDWTGGPCHHGGQVVAAGDRHLHRLALEILAWGAAGKGNSPARIT